MYTLFGWNMKQLGAAKAYHYSITNENLEPDLQGITKLKMFWQSRRNDEPLGTTFINAEPEIDLKWACDAFGGNYR